MSENELQETSQTLPNRLDRFVMPHNQLGLKTKLKLKKLTKHIDDAVEWNFGYSPNELWFDKLIDERRQLEEFAKREFPLIYAEHCNRVYGA